MRIAPLALALLLCVNSSSAADDGDVVPKKWLVLPGVDVVARRPLRPDAVFATYLLDRTSSPPKEGDEVTGTLGKSAKWISRDADAKGEVRAEDIVWSYARVESDADRVAIAKLERASLLFVNGAGFTGDVYGLGDAGVPVALRKGANDVYVVGPRGAFRLTLRKPDAAVEFDTKRLSAPDAIDGRSDFGQASCLVLNATNAPADLAGRDAPLPPLGVGRRTFDVKRADSPRSGGIGVVCDGQTFLIPGKNSWDARRCTFISRIDGSVQSYALVPPEPSGEEEEEMGLVLSLHGAGVECMSQAKAYAPKRDFWIACPTNRGNYGFDWQDWGRLDAYEVLRDALHVSGVRQRRVYLTGHSMGGHGTWHLAANGPGDFLAIAPSAGWSGFDSPTFGGSQTSPLSWMWRAADGASQTMDLVSNLAPIPTYVLHGEKDDNIPASEAHLMVDALTKAGGRPESHFEPEAGHWWDDDQERPGADCVDWPGIWELFRKSQPPAESAREVAFTTMDLSMDSGSRWIDLDQPVEYGRPSRITAKWDGKQGLAIATENIRRFRVSFGPWWVEVKTLTVTLDGRTFIQRGDVQDFERDATGTWQQRVPPETRVPSSQKSSSRGGPFKRAFDNSFVLVYGTAGDDDEDRELLEKARYDSEVWAYRANGDANLMSDVEFLANKRLDSRNVVLYGNADTNSAWTAVFDDDCPIVAKRGSMTVGGTKHDSVVAAAFVRPRKDSDKALAAAFADTGAAATRLFYGFPVFSSGVGIPDYVVFGPGFLHELDGDVRAAGWFDYAWRMR